MNFDRTPNPREELEARLTSLLLGELPAEEAATLRQSIDQDPELAKLERRLKVTIGLVQETVASPEEKAKAEPAALHISEAKREKLLAHFKTVKPKEFQEQNQHEDWSGRLVAIAAVLVGTMVLASLLLPALSKAKLKAKRYVAGQYDVLPSQEATDLRTELAKAPQTMSPVSSTPPPTPVRTPARTTIVLPQSAGNQMEVALNDRKAPSDAVSPGATDDLSLVTPAAHQQVVSADSGSGVGGGGERQPTDTLFENRSGAYRLVTPQTVPPAGETAAVEKLISQKELPPLATTADSFQSGGVSPSAGLPAAPGAGWAAEANGPSVATAAPKIEVGQGFSVQNHSQPQNLREAPQRNYASGGGGGGGGFGGGLLAPTTPPPTATPPSSIFLPSRSQLADASKAENESLGAGEPSVKLQAKFADVTQEDSKKLGWSWQAAGKDGSALQPGLAGQDREAGANSPKLTLGDTTTISGKSEAKVPLLDDVPMQGSMFRGPDKDVRERGEAASTLSVQNSDSLQTFNGVVSGVAASTNYLAFDTKRPEFTSVLERPPALAEPSPGASGQGTPLRTPSKMHQNQGGASVGPLTAESLRHAVPMDEVAAGRTAGTNAFFFGTRAELQSTLAALESAESSTTNMIVVDASTSPAKAGDFLANSFDQDSKKMREVAIVDKAVPATRRSSTAWESLVGGGKYKSVARVKVEGDQADARVTIEGLRGATAFDPYFIQTESEVVQSQAVLGKVAKDLKLDQAWAKSRDGRKLTSDETLALLKKNLEVKPARNGALLDIGFKSDKPDEAAKIANAIAEAYQEDRAQKKQEIAGSEIKLAKNITKNDSGAVRLPQQAPAEKIAPGAQAPQTASRRGREADVAPARPTLPPPVPQPEILTRENSFSTFSLNVSDVSFKLAQASLATGVMPEPDSIRSEEFINAFDYRDPEPGPGAAMAFAWERARYPFTQNRDILRFSLKTAARGRQAGRPLNLVLLLDSSGSMERADRARIIHEALRVLAGQLQPQDVFSVVTFARTAHLFVDGVSGTQAGKVAEDLSGLTPEGGTNLEDAIDLAYATALRHYQAKGINRVVLLTDGAANLGNVEPDVLKQKVETNRKQGIALDCFGIGWDGYNDDLLEVLSRNGDGRYGFINTPEDAASRFVGELAGALHVAASDVKVQVEFNPKRVTSYRQIGYAKHQLTKKQFRDNTVDAAEIGAAESGNALYVVEANPAGEGPLGSVRVRYKIPGTSDYREQEWAVPYNGNALALDQASSAMKLAATASAFSEWLASSPYASDVTPDALLGYVLGVPEIYGADTRPKTLEWMLRQATSLEGSRGPAATAPAPVQKASAPETPASRSQGFTNGF